MSPAPDLTQLSPQEKRQLLAKLLQRQGEGPSSSPTPQTFPLAFAQQRLWFIDQLEPGQTVYTIPGAIRLQGPLQVELLQQCLNEIVARHEILRTRFIDQQGEPLQVVEAHLSIDLPIIEVEIDLAGKDSEPLTTAVATHLKSLVAQPFDLETGPLLRCQLLRLNEGDHVLALTVHHIVADYWSLRVLMQEIALLYPALSTGNPVPLSPLPIQYADYAVWQHEQQQLQTQLDYWLQKLANPPSVLQLPIDYPRPAVQTFKGARRHFALTSELSIALETLAQKHQTTLFMTLLAAFKVLLCRYTNQVDILVGSTVTNRDRAELQTLIGLFVNNLVFRSQVEPDLSFVQLLMQIKTTALDAYAHQDIPFEQVVDALQIDRQLSHNALFQVMFILHNTPKTALALPDLTVTALELNNNTSRFDLSLDMYETESGLTGVFEYNTDLFAASTIDRMVGHFETLLQGIVAQPNAEIGQLPLLTTAEQQTLAAWNQTEAAIPAIGAHQLFEAQVEKQGDAIALSVDLSHADQIFSQFVTPETTWTYQHLNQRANQVARYLQSLGAGSGSRIAFALDRGPDLVIVILAILKCGGIYIPLDPSHPSERLQYVLEDSGAVFFLASSDAGIELPKASAHVQKVDLKAVSAQIEQHALDNLDVPVRPNDLAYMIYTSGSTGKPKGVPICHRSLVNLLTSMAHAPGITAKDTLLAVTTVAFDIATLELLLPLTVGARLVIASTETVCDASRLITQIAVDDITVMQATPATWRLLIEAGWEGNAHLKILCGGEALDSALAQVLLSRCYQLWNMYGPTETTIWSGVLQVDAVELMTVPIGGAIHNTQFHVLDPQQQPVPIGIPGELYIGGAGLSPGYWHRSELTATRFLSGQDISNTRLYRTGDCVRYRADGTLDYLGRFDHQIKLRGFRIDPGEIEAVLLSYDHIEQALVILAGDAPQLVAYCKVLEDDGLAPGTVRQFLSQQLPAYMLPSVYVWLTEFPLTPNGKIDRQALPAPVSAHNDEGTIPPRTKTEQQLAQIWAEVLNHPAISANDNFFDLGGHSLLAARVIARLQTVFKVTVPLRALFESPHLSDLAQIIDAAQGETEQLIQPVSREQALPLSFAQQRQWVLAQLEPESGFYNIPAAVWLEGQFSFSLLEESLNLLCQRHEGLRTCFRSIDGTAELVIMPQVKLPVAYTYLPGASEETILNQLQVEAQRPFELRTAPLLRVQVFHVGPQTHVVSLVIHHIVADAWSVGLLVQELVSVYGQLQAQQSVELPPLPLQYVDYAAWQRTLDLAAQLRYWQQHLADTPPLLPLPTDYPRSATQQFAGGSYRFTLTPEQAIALKHLSQGQNTTLFMTLLTAFKVLLYRYSGATDLVVGTPIAHRPQAALEGIVGMFVNTLVLRSHLSAEMPFVELLQQVRETALNAYSHQDVPFEQVIDALNIPRTWSYSPLFQVMFVWQAQAPKQLAAEVNGLSWSTVALESTTTKVDLTLFMAEDEGHLRGRFEYRQDLFAPATIEAMAEAFCTLLGAISQTPQATVSALPLLPPRQRQQLIQWNLPSSFASSELCLHHLFEQQVLKTPTSTALRVQNQKLTYQELDTRANQLAQYLQFLGIGPESRVGVCLGRSVDLVVAILAILKAGGAYVPLDPTYPMSRLNYILEDAQIFVVLTEQKYQEFTASLSDPLHIVFLDVPIKTVSPSDSITVQSDNLAYIIYTSGSTGRPKGVAIEHHSPVALVQWAQATFSAEQLSGVLASTSICFDLSVFELFVPLSSGGTIILADDVLQVPELPAKEAITLINTVPTAIAELMSLEGIPRNVSTINLAGEPIPPILVNQLYQLESIENVFNLYGPSEDTTYSTYIGLDADVGVVPIGRPIANTQAYILDDRLHPVPIGMPGELHLAGEGIARGYWQRPELTAERFIPNAFAGPKEKGRLYKTGDRVRYRPDGQLEFLGRMDAQVKLRGFRIELGEIEAALLQHPEIAQAVTRVWTDNQGNRRLVAYLKWEQRVEAEWGHVLWPEAVEGLRSHLQNILPPYMIPALYVPLQELPRLPNGKLDRRSLPAPILRKNPNENTAPRTEIEGQLVEIWQTLLQQPVDIDDNFFTLGGDSILAIQAVARAQQVGLYFSPRDLFQHSTIAQLAPVVQTQAATIVSQEPLAGWVPLTPIQQWFFEQSFDHLHHWNQAVLLTVQQPLMLEPLVAALRLLLTHHDGLRATFQSTATSWQQYYGAPSETVPFTVVRRTVEKIEPEIMAVANSVQAGFDLTTGPLWHLVYFDFETPTGPERRLLMVCHHLIVDGISWRILLEDLQLLYLQLHQAGTAQLPLKSFSTKDWVERLQTLERSSEIPYWHTVTQAELAPLPVDFAGGDNTMAQAETFSVALTVDETRCLLQEVPAAYPVQMNDLLLTALGLALKPWAGPTLRLAVEGHGRPDDLDLSRTVGWLTALYPLLIKLPEQEELGAIIKAVKETVRSVPDQGLGYGILRYLQGHAVPATETPIRFNYLGQTDQLFANSEWFTSAPESTGSSRSPYGCRDVLIEINAVISQGHLKLHWTYSRRLHRQGTISDLARAHVEQLRGLMEYCLSADTDPGYSPADFPQMALAQDELDQLLDTLDFSIVGGQDG